MKMELFNTKSVNRYHENVWNWTCPSRSPSNLWSVSWSRWAWSTSYFSSDEHVPDLTRHPDLEGTLVFAPCGLAISLGNLWTWSSSLEVLGHNNTQSTWSLLGVTRPSRSTFKFTRLGEVCRTLIKPKPHNFGSMAVLKSCPKPIGLQIVAWLSRRSVFKVDLLLPKSAGVANFTIRLFQNILIYEATCFIHTWFNHDWR